MKDIVIIGCGGFGREVAWLIEEINNVNQEWNILGFIDDDTLNHGQIINGYTVLGGFEYLKEKKNIYYVCAIGSAKSRRRIVEEKCSKYNIIPATLVHPSVLMNKKNVYIGEGSIVCASNILTVNINVGKHTLINLDCTIGHDVIIEDYVTIYPSVNISGNCKVALCSELGTGTHIIQGKNIGKGTIIGAGTVVIRDIGDNCVAVGNPARVIKVMEDIYEKDIIRNNSK